MVTGQVDGSKSRDTLTLISELFLNLFPVGIMRRQLPFRHELERSACWDRQGDKKDRLDLHDCTDDMDLRSKCMPIMNSNKMIVDDGLDRAEAENSSSTMAF
jgi:hypothetical protein